MEPCLFLDSPVYGPIDIIDDLPLWCFILDIFPSRPLSQMYAKKYVFFPVPLFRLLWLSETGSTKNWGVEKAYDKKCLDPWDLVMRESP